MQVGKCQNISFKALVKTGGKLSNLPQLEKELKAIGDNNFIHKVILEAGQAVINVTTKGGIASLTGPIKVKKGNLNDSEFIKKILAKVKEIVAQYKIEK